MRGDEQATSGPFRAGGRTAALTASGWVVVLGVEDPCGLTAATRLLGDFEALQLVWRDSTDRVPWELGYRNPPEAQLLPGRG